MESYYLLELELLNLGSDHEGPFIFAKVIYGGTYKLATLEGDELARSVNDIPPNDGGGNQY